MTWPPPTPHDQTSLPAERWVAHQIPTAPQPQLAPQSRLGSFQTSSSGSPVSARTPSVGRLWGWPGWAGAEAVHKGIRESCVSAPETHWALIAAALAAGILAVSCLFCAICCRRQCCHHKKKPQDKEVMNLGSAHSSTTTHLVRSSIILARSLEDSANSSLWGSE